MSPKKDTGFSDFEKAAMKERAKELKAAERADRDRAAGESDLLTKVAELVKSDRLMATHVHEIVTANAPDLWPKTWYGMPAYARNGKVVCFFQGAKKFDTRYCTLGFNDTANLDDGPMWPTSFAILEWTDEVEKRIAALVRKAIS